MSAIHHPWCRPIEIAADFISYNNKHLPSTGRTAKKFRQFIGPKNACFATNSKATL